MKWIGMALGALLLLASVAFAATDAPPALEPSSLLDNVSEGAGWLHFSRERVNYAVTECWRLHYRDCGPGSPHPNRVFATGATQNTAQLLVDLHPFGAKHSDDAFLSPDSLFASLVTGYGVLADNKHLLEGEGVGYTLVVLDGFQRKDFVNVGLGTVYLNDQQVLRRGVHIGGLEPNVRSPAHYTRMVAPMLDVTLRM